MSGHKPWPPKKKIDDGTLGFTGKVGAGCGHMVDTRQLVYVHLFQDSKEIAVETRCPDCAEGLMEYKK